MLRFPTCRLSVSFIVVAMATVTLLGGAGPLFAQSSSSSNPAFPPSSKILDGYTKVVTSLDGPGLFTLWKKKNSGQVIAELPRNYLTKKYFIALTISAGDRMAGLQQGDLYVYWRRFDKRLALMHPNLSIRATGDTHAKASVDRLFTDRILLDMQILAIGPSGGPLIRLDELLVMKGSRLFPRDVSPNLTYTRYGMYAAKKTKAFPKNVEVAFEVPSSRGQMQTLHYSISEISSSTGYKPRKADERIGYFTTSYSDLGKYSDYETQVRYINRWHLQKRDPSLKLSPPEKTDSIHHRAHNAGSIPPVGQRRGSFMEPGLREDWHFRRDRSCLPGQKDRRVYGH